MTVVPGTATLARRLAAFATATDASQIPAEVVDAAKLHTLDVLGCALAANGTGAGAYVQQAAVALGSGGPASVIGRPEGHHAAAAALANGGLAHALDFDDTHTGAIAHISAVVVPAALATAEAFGASGADAVTAIVLGSETVARIGAVGTPAYMKTGFHPTSVAGVFGATVAASWLTRLSEHETAHALGIAGSMAGGLFEYLGDGSTTKAVNAGWAAHGGVMAAALAAAGGDGPATVLEGRFGVFASHYRLPAGEGGDDWDLGGRWETPATSFKPYPACHFIHSSLDAARALLDEGLDPAQIDDVLVEVPPPALPLILEPVADKLAPRTPYDAKFSLQYSLAAMLLHGSVGIDTYSPDRIGDTATLALATRVHHAAADFDAYPKVFPTRLTVTTTDGRTLTKLSPPSDVSLPFGRDDVRSKFQSNASLALGEADVEALERGILALDEATAVGGVLEPLRRAQRREAA